MSSRLGALLLGLSLACTADPGPDAGSRPSLLLITVDTLRADRLAW